jgi:hypothetical protein
MREELKNKIYKLVELKVILLLRDSFVEYLVSSRELETPLVIHPVRIRKEGSLSSRA